ncbi:MAG: glycosyltransferase family 4 protein [Desulfobacteraceae bacterium]|nr:glycosyltransferase family 4 protein [Desulfobacteraceae bacterium]
MKIAIIAPTPIPFLIGGAEKFFWGLQHHCNQLTGHDVELIKVPCDDHTFWPLIEGYQRFSRLDLSYFDLLVSTKYPAWITPHHNHHLYMQHKCRGLYDLYRGPEPDVSLLPSVFSPVLRIITGPPDRGRLEELFAQLFSLRARQEIPAHWFSLPSAFTILVVRWLDDLALAPGEMQSYSAISKNVTTRKRYFPPGVNPRIIHHPSDLQGLHCRDYQHIFTASRLADLKRVDLLVKAMQQVKGEIEFHIAGTGAEAEALHELAASDRRIKFLGYINDVRLMEEYANALFVPFVPMDEDYGLITIESMQSAKAVLTSHDAGGVNEFVEHGVNGMIVDPVPEAIAGAMQQLVDDRRQTEEMGKKALQRAGVITWQNTVAALMEQLEAGHCLPSPSGGRGKRRKRLVVASTFPIFPPTSGGQARIYNLYRQLGAQAADIRIVSLAGSQTKPCDRVIAPGLEEVCIPKTAAHEAREEALGQELGTSCGDISCINDFALTPDYLEQLAASCAAADLVVLSHPYMYRAVRQVWQKSVWYDAHNVEVDMKRAVFGRETNVASEWIEVVHRLEGDCCRDAESVLVCSELDAARLIKLYGPAADKIHLAPNGVDCDAILPFRGIGDSLAVRRRLGLDGKRVFLFIGSWHGPNIEAVIRIKAWAALLPEAVFLIVGTVGRHPSGKENSPANMLFLDTLSERQKAVVFQVSDVALNPMTSGSGTNLKMLDYAAWGLPVVSTPYGNRGLCFADSEHLVLAEIAEFPSRLQTIVKKGVGEELAVMAERAREVARERYDWRVIAAGVAPFLLAD